MDFHHNTLSGTYPHAAWRVITLQDADGPMNMAIDEAIAEAVGAGAQPPTLRFYAWDPPCLSLGFSQPFTDVETQALYQHGWGLVRRLTGGRAILHIDELTYSIAIPDSDPRVEGGVVESYRRLSRGLQLGLQTLGAAVESDPGLQEARKFKGAVCFEVPSDYEITANGRKLIGSAQTRRSSAVLQHGALPLCGDITRIVDVLAFADPGARDLARVRVLQRAITLEEALGAPVQAARVARALMDGFARALNLTFISAELSPAEEQRAAEIRAARYAAVDWTQRL